jgi:molybdopterin converting factor small subunit
LLARKEPIAYLDAAEQSLRETGRSRLCFARYSGGSSLMHVEFYGVPRARACISGLEVQADTLGQLLGTLEARIPSLSDVLEGGRLQRSFVASLNGDRFITDPSTPLREDDCVLILSADAGG